MCRHKVAVSVKFLRFNCHLCFFHYGFCDKLRFETFEYGYVIWFDLTQLPFFLHYITLTPPGVFCSILGVDLIKFRSKAPRWHIQCQLETLLRAQICANYKNSKNIKVLCMFFEVQRWHEPLLECKVLFASCFLLLLYSRPIEFDFSNLCVSYTVVQEKRRNPWTTPEEVSSISTPGLSDR